LPVHEPQELYHGERDVGHAELGEGPAAGEATGRVGEHDRGAPKLRLHERRGRVVVVEDLRLECDVRVRTCGCLGEHGLVLLWCGRTSLTWWWSPCGFRESRRWFDCGASRLRSP